MTSRQAFLALVGAIVLLIAAAGLMTNKGSQMLRQKGDELVERKLQNQVLNKREESLLQAKSDIQRYTELEQIAKAIVPQEKDQARTIREITKIAQQTGTPIAGFRFPASALGAVQKGRAAVSSNPETSQLTPVDGAKGLYAMEITVLSPQQVAIATFPSLVNFLEKLEQNRRTAHVTDITIKPDEKNRDFISFTVTLNVYIKP